MEETTHIVVSTGDKHEGESDYNETVADTANNSDCHTTCCDVSNVENIGETTNRSKTHLVLPG